MKCSKILKSCFSITIMLCLLGSSLTRVFAVTTLKVSANVSSVKSGGSFQVTVDIPYATGMVYFSADNGTVSQSSTYCVESCSVNVTAGNKGNVIVSVSPGQEGTKNEVSDKRDDYVVTNSGSVSVAIISSGGENSGGNSGGNSGENSNSGGGSSSGGQTNTTNPKPANEEGKSSNANLSALSISEGDLDPVFSADTTSYTVTLGKEATSLTVNASASDAKASVSGTGEHSLQAGKNEITIAVTAEDGTVKNYVITVNVEEAPEIFVNYNDKKLGVVKDTSDVSVPDTFEETTVTLSGSEIKAWHSNLRNLTIVYMVDEANEKNFYLFDESAKTITSVYKPIGFMGRNVAIIDVPKELQTRAGMTFTELDIDGMKFPGWTYDSKTFENYSLLYLMDEQGNVHYYQYEKSEGTLQLFSDAAPLTQSEYEAALKESNGKLQQRMWMIIALLATNLITIGLLIYVMMKKRSARNKKIASIGPNAEIEKFEEEPVLLNSVERIPDENSPIQIDDESDAEA